MMFLLLGTLQLFMMMHGRILTQLAAFQATRTGSLNHGNCWRMLHSGILQVLPAIEPFARNNGVPLSANLGAAFNKYRFNNYSGMNVNVGTGLSRSLTGPVLWIVRDFTGRPFTAGQEDSEFDQDLAPMVLETRVIFWCPMKIPFANWVIARTMMAHYGIQSYSAQNPLMINMRATNWSAGATSLQSEIQAELAARLVAGQYVFPIIATYTMRMMTPLKVANQVPKNCPGTPQTL